MYKILPIFLFTFGLCGFIIDNTINNQPYSECIDNTGGLVFYLTSQSYIKLDAPITCEKAKEELGCAFEIYEPPAADEGGGIGAYGCLAQNLNGECISYTKIRSISEYCPKTCGLCEKEIVSYEELSKSIKALHLDILNEIDAKTISLEKAIELIEKSLEHKSPFIVDET